MKKFILLLTLLLCNNLFSYGTEVHPYITTQAYQLLSYYFPQINSTELAYQLGSLNSEGDGPWSTGLITTGSIREDLEDVVYLLGPQNSHPLAQFLHFLVNSSPSVTVTHFYKGDDPDYSNVSLLEYPAASYPNAYQKAIKYINGGWKLQYLESGSNYIKEYVYYSLIDLVKTGQIFQTGYYTVFPCDYTALNPPQIVRLSDTKRKKFAYEILGRILHLLQDMSVPAHVHSDGHYSLSDYGAPCFGAPFCDEHDIYEDFVTLNFAQSWDFYDAVDAGGFVDFNSDNPLKYLFYTANQIADAFPSNDVPGNFKLPQGTYPIIADYYNQINNQSPPLNATGLCASKNLVYSIRATASFLLWFCQQTDFLKTFTMNSNYASHLQIKNPAGTGSYYWKPLPYSLSFSSAITVDLMADPWPVGHVWATWQKRDKKNVIISTCQEFEWRNASASATSTFTAFYDQLFTLNLNPVIYEGQSGNGYYNNLTTSEVSSVFQLRKDYAYTILACAPTGYNFVYWSDGNLSNPRDFRINTNRSGIYAVFKASMKSSNNNAYANNSQRKIVRSDDGKLHMVYESMGYVWYERSTNGGTTWQIMNGGKPIDSNPGRSPSIDVLYQQGNYITEVYIVYQTHASGSNDMAAIKVAYFVDDQVAGHQLQYINTADVGSVFYNEANYNPVVAKIYPGKVLVAWDGGYGIRYRIGTQISGGISWGVDTPAGNSSSAEKFPTIAAYKTYPNGIFHLAWQNSYSTINYCSFTFQQNGTFTVSSVTNVSQGCGYPTNYFPSINVSSSNQVYLVWIGCPYYNSSTRKTISRLKTTTWSSSFGQYGDKVLSPGAAFGGGNSIIAWSENPSTNTYTNKFLKYGSVKTAGTTGKDIQVFNADNLNNIFISSFNSNALPYYFSQSANLYSINKESSIAFASGVQAVAYNGKAEYYFRVGDISVNGTSVDFKDFEAPEAKIPINDLNKNLVTNEFPFNGNDKLTFSVEYGVTDSLLALSQLSDSKSISFKLELVDMSTGDAIMDINKFTLDEKNLASQVSNTYEYEVKGMEGKKVAIRVKLANNFKPDYATAVIKSDKNVLPKGSVICMDLTGTLTISDYALEQNYPNPFNPVTKISWQSPVGSHQTLKVFDVLGSEVTTLVNEWREAGRYSINFNGLDLPSGVYIYQLKVNDFVSSKKLILLK